MTKLTASKIREIAGRLDEGRIIELLKTDASEEEFLEAFEWLYSDDVLSRERHEAPSARIALVRDILNRAETATEEDR